MLAISYFSSNKVLTTEEFNNSLNLIIDILLNKNIYSLSIDQIEFLINNEQSIIDFFNVHTNILLKLLINKINQYYNNISNECINSYIAELSKKDNIDVRLKEKAVIKKIKMQCFNYISLL